MKNSSAPQTGYLKISGSNSVVECNLAKVEVEGSNPFSRSIFLFPHLLKLKGRRRQVAKAGVCKTPIGGSNPPGASSFVLNGTFKA